MRRRQYATYEVPRFGILHAPHPWVLKRPERFQLCIALLDDRISVAEQYAGPANDLAAMVLSHPPFAQMSEPVLERLRYEFGLAAAVGMALGHLELGRNSPSNVEATTLTALAFAGTKQEIAADLPEETGIWADFVRELGFFAARNGWFDSKNLWGLRGLMPKPDPPPPQGPPPPSP